MNSALESEADVNLDHQAAPDRFVTHCVEAVLSQEFLLSRRLFVLVEFDATVVISSGQ